MFEETVSQIENADNADELREILADARIDLECSQIMADQYQEIKGLVLRRASELGITIR